MSNYKGHVTGGVIAYVIMLVLVVLASSMIGHLPIPLTSSKYSLLLHAPTALTAFEYAIHIYFPPIARFLEQLLTLCVPWLITLTEWFLFALAGAMFPDIDIKSKSQQHLYILVLFIIIICIGQRQFNAVAFMSIISLLPIFTKHRGIFHRLWFVVGVPLGLWFWISILFPSYSVSFFYCILFFIGGAISHLWLDMGIKKMLQW